MGAAMLRKVTVSVCISCAHLEQRKDIEVLLHVCRQDQLNDGSSGQKGGICLPGLQKECQDLHSQPTHPTP